MLRNNLLVFLYHRFHQLEFRTFQSLVLNEFNREYSKFCSLVTFYNMNMNWLMVVRIKHKSEPNKLNNVGILSRNLKYDAK